MLRQVRLGWTTFAAASLILTVTSGWLPIHIVVSEGFGQTDSHSREQSNAEAGRSIFNGKGICYYCHGIDGYREKRPQLELKTIALIDQLQPPPPDLRDTKSLRLKSDKERAKLIREGHLGTGMFPETG